MALTQITYNDKSDYQSSSLANEYKVSASDMNEIKTIVNDVCTQVDNSITYSTTETVVGYDYDNKPIYRKVFTGNLNGLESTQTIAHGISDLKEFKFLNGVGTTTANQFWAIPIRYSSTQYVSIRADATNIYLNSTSDFTNKPFSVVVEYKKTTD